MIILDNHKVYEAKLFHSYLHAFILHSKFDENNKISIIG